MRRNDLHRKCAEMTGYIPPLTLICDYQKTRRSLK
nr:MAG TPA: Circadian-associated transcriptional repressor [Caudoviricetes sp.]